MATSGHPQALPPGSVLNWYTVHHVLGQGGFGITYLAVDCNLGQPVAIKEYLPLELATRGPRGRVRSVTATRAAELASGLADFVSEARTLARFDHPAIVRVLSVFEMNGTAYMVMPFEQGHSLQEMLHDRATLDEQWVKRMLVRVADGLAGVHAAGYIHRDIKPANIFIRADASPVLLDFGSARQALGQATRTFTSLVSPGYAPFEQYLGKSDRQGPWTDVYGLGATAYRALTGVVPIDALERSERLLDDRLDPYVPAAALASDRCSPAFLAAVDRALAFRDVDRPATLAAWLDEIEPQAAASAVATTRLATTVRLPHAIEPAARVHPAPARRTATSRRVPARAPRRASARAAGILALVGAGALAAVVTHRHATPVPPPRPAPTADALVAPPAPPPTAEADVPPASAPEAIAPASGPAPLAPDPAPAQTTPAFASIADAGPPPADAPASVASLGTDAPPTPVSDAPGPQARHAWQMEQVRRRLAEGPGRAAERLRFARHRLGLDRPRP